MSRTPAAASQPACQGCENDGFNQFQFIHVKKCCMQSIRFEFEAFVTPERGHANQPTVHKHAVHIYAVAGKQHIFILHSR